MAVSLEDVMLKTRTVQKQNNIHELLVSFLTLSRYINFATFVVNISSTGCLHYFVQDNRCLFFLHVYIRVYSTRNFLLKGLDIISISYVYFEMLGEVELISLLVPHWDSFEEYCKYHCHYLA